MNNASEECYVAVTPRGMHIEVLAVEYRDISSERAITPEHVSEAIQYRTFDRTLWV